MAQRLTIIFDCDGVLVDSERLSHTVLKEMLAEQGRDLSLQDTFDYFMGTSTEKCRAIFSELTGRPAPLDFTSIFRDRTFDAFRASLAPVPGITELLHHLTHPFCVASNGPREKMRFTLGHTGLLPHFEGRLFSADDVAHPKPAPDLFLHAANAMNTEPKACVVVEDSPTGVTAAKAAGMFVLGYAAMGQELKLSAAGADRLLRHMSDFHRVLPSALGSEQ
jgi:HAD superfamily hydrolase (TIGR01509 family)